MMRQLNRETYDKFFEPISNKFHEQNTNESELDAVIPTFHPMMIFPPEHLTLEELTLKSEYIMSNSNYIVDLLIARKMEAIRRLQRMGAQFSYRIYPEQ
jgi:hypothetical protein